MSLKIQTNQSVVAYHVTDGPVTFPYSVDAHSAVSNHPFEWSWDPWSRDDAANARKMLKERHERETKEAEARYDAKQKEAQGMPAPLAFDDDVELTPEEQAALDAHDKAVAEAKERLEAFRAKKAEEKAEADQAAADEAIVKSFPPAPEIRRPFGRKGEPTPAELEQIKKREAKKADDDRIAAEKKKADQGLV